MADQRVLTVDEVDALGEEYRKLLTQAHVQLLEQRKFLQLQIRVDPRLNDAQRNNLCQEADALECKMVTVSDDNVLHLAQVQVVYEFPDILYSYLKQPADKLPEGLRGFLDGGSEIEVKDAAVDPAPKTGKTRRRV